MNIKVPANIARQDSTDTRRSPTYFKAKDKIKTETIAIIGAIAYNTPSCSVVNSNSSSGDVSRYRQTTHWGWALTHLQQCLLKYKWKRTLRLPWGPKSFFISKTESHLLPYDDATCRHTTARYIVLGSLLILKAVFGLSKELIVSSVKTHPLRSTWKKNRFGVGQRTEVLLEALRWSLSMLEHSLKFSGGKGGSMYHIVDSESERVLSEKLQESLLLLNYLGPEEM